MHIYNNGSFCFSVSSLLDSRIDINSSISDKYLFGLGNDDSSFFY